jgi:hypothetical protein
MTRWIACALLVWGVGCSSGNAASPDQIPPVSECGFGYGPPLPNIEADGGRTCVCCPINDAGQFEIKNVKAECVAFDGGC